MMSKVWFITGDEARAKTAVDEAVKQFGRIDVVVNNAGYSLLGNFEEMTTAEIQRQFATNFYSVMYVMRAVLPVMRKQRSGHIINISSVAGVVGLKHCAAYGATKFAVEGLSLSVATEVEQFGVKITVVAPGFFRTDYSGENCWHGEAAETVPRRKRRPHRGCAGARGPAAGNACL